MFLFDWCRAEMWDFDCICTQCHSTKYIWAIACWFREYEVVDITRGSPPPCEWDVLYYLLWYWIHQIVLSLHVCSTGRDVKHLLRTSYEFSPQNKWLFFTKRKWNTVTVILHIFSWQISTIFLQVQFLNNWVMMMITLQKWINLKVTKLPNIFQICTGKTPICSDWLF